MIDASECAREAVHIPGTIQPHGVMLVLSIDHLEVSCISENATLLMGLDPQKVVGSPLSSFAKVRSGAGASVNLREDHPEEHNPIRLELTSGRTFDAIVHRHDGRILVESEPEDREDAVASSNMYRLLQRALGRLRAAPDLHGVCEKAASEMQGMTGFDRILIYRFHPDWSGEVVGEGCASGPRRYFGLRFPASDIPTQARALYTSCLVRMTATSTYVPAKLVGRQDGRPIDLTHAILRSVSPVHLEYMRNMGVTASLGFSIIRNGRLWGLITCNHESGPKVVPYETRSACALLGEFVSTRVDQCEELAESEQLASAHVVQTGLLQSIARERDVPAGLTRHLPSLLDVTHSTGAVLSYGGEIHAVGAVPPLDAVKTLVTWLEEHPPETRVLDSLPEHYPPAAAWKDVGCGLIASPVSFARSAVVNQRCWLLWFRPEVAQTVSWGGNPDKPLGAGPEGRLHPRLSFQLWKQEVYLRSAPFSAAEVTAAQALAAVLPNVIVDIEASRRIKEGARQLEATNRELHAQIRQTQKVEMELRQAQKLEAVGRLAAGVAHEINTPLQFVGDSIAFLTEASGALLSSSRAVPPGLSPEEAEDWQYFQREMPNAIGRAKEGVDRVAAIVRAMKAFAHPDGAEKVLADLDEAIVATVEIARGALSHVADVSLDLGALPKLLCYVGELNQVFLNLIINASQAIEDTLSATRTRGRISIRSWATPGDIFVSVSDDGCGIPSAIRESVFLPFFTTKEVGRGTGQGLAIAHSIVVEKHGGGLSFESEVGRGTIFTIRLPVGSR